MNVGCFRSRTGDRHHRRLERHRPRHGEAGRAPRARESSSPPATRTTWSAPSPTSARDGGRAIHVVADVADPQRVDAIAEAAIRRVRPHRHVGQQRRGVDLRARHAAADRGHAPADGRELLGPGLRLARRGAAPARSQGGALINVASALADRAIPLQANYCRREARAEGLHRRLARGAGGRGRADLRHAGRSRPASTRPFFQKAKTYLGVEPQPVPPVYAPEVVAEVILHAAQHPVRELIAGGSGREDQRRAGSRPASPTCTWSAGRSTRRAPTTPVDGRADNLDEPVSDDGGERGRHWSGHTRNSSLYTSAFLHPRAAAAATLVGLVGLAAGLALTRVAASGRRSVAHSLRRASVGESRIPRRAGP